MYVQKISMCVCLQHLWVMVVQEADLTGQLRVMKDFFLLGRGELCLAFIDQAQHLLKGPPAPSTEHGQWHLAWVWGVETILLSGPSHPKHRAWSVTSHSGLGCGDYSVMWSFTPQAHSMARDTLLGFGVWRLFCYVVLHTPGTEHGQWHLTWVWGVQTILLCGPSHPKHTAWSVTPHLGLGCADYSVMWSFTPQAHSTVIAASVRFGCRDCYVVLHTPSTQHSQWHLTWVWGVETDLWSPPAQI